MESFYKGIFIGNPSKVYTKKKKAARKFKFKKKNKRTIHIVLITLALIGIPIGIETISNSSYIISFILIATVYPFIYILYQCDKKAMRCKHMP